MIYFLAPRGYSPAPRRRRHRRTMEIISKSRRSPLTRCSLAASLSLRACICRAARAKDAVHVQYFNGVFVFVFPRVKSLLTGVPFGAYDRFLQRSSSRRTRFSRSKRPEKKTVFENRFVSNGPESFSICNWLTARLGGSYLNIFLKKKP